MGSTSPTTTKGQGLVLITGANGFVAGRMIESFLLAGYSVRGTVRSLASSTALLQTLKPWGTRFTLIEVPDITVPGAFDTAVKDVDYIAHVAAPVSFMFTDPEPVIHASLAGTTGILESAMKEENGKGVKHFVFMSSIVAVTTPVEKVFTEEDWNVTAPAVVAEKGKEAGGYHIYQASKVAAERALWRFREERKPRFGITALNPVFVAGPSLLPYPTPKSVHEALWIWRDLFLGVPVEKAGLPSPMKAYVDVRDLARFTRYAMEHPEDTEGQRFILAGVGHGPAQSVADILREAVPEWKGRIDEGHPGEGYTLPGYVHPPSRGVDGSKAGRLLGAYIPWEKTVLDTARSLEHLIPKGE